MNTLPTNYAMQFTIHMSVHPKTGLVSLVVVNPLGQTSSLQVSSLEVANEKAMEIIRDQLDDAKGFGTF